MDTILALLFLSTSAFMVSRFFTGHELIDTHLAVLGLFSIGYYPLVVLLKFLTPLQFESEHDIFAALSIHWLFIIMLLFGVYIGKRFIAKKVKFEVNLIDNFLYKNKFYLSMCAFCVYMVYYFTQPLTSYSSSDFEGYFNNRGPLFVIISTFGGLSLAFLAISVAAIWAERKMRQLLVVSSLFIICVILTLKLGQRLTMLTPIIILFVGLIIFKMRKKAFNVILAVVFSLVLFSPFAVYFRSTRTDSIVGERTSSGFSYGDNPATTMLQSILDRGDLIYNTVKMKPYIDNEPLPGPIYYASVAAIPIPKFILKNKPYILSTNGSQSGELSILTWITQKGSLTGSLTAFGGLVAYREARWFGVVLNGFSTGLLFVFFSRWLGGGGYFAKVLYGALFVTLAVKKVPPSFFEAMAEFMGLLPFIILASILASLLSRKRSRIRR